ncbi:MAG TPA: hypothetical protein VEC11_12815 [Allosphingosinicella sp.]|nr:hypothetical protein [Allosphingosinicella sp.]
MRLPALLLPLVVAASLAAPAGAIPPAPTPVHYYYGPIRICTPHFAFDVRAGEAWWDATPQHYVYSGRHRFKFGEPWSLDGPQHRDFVNPMGTLDVPGIGRLERVQLTARNWGGPYIVYLYDLGSGRKVQIQFDEFDGTDADVARFARLAAGERRAAMCRDVPEALRPRPEREDRNAFYLSQRRHPGPLTLCWSSLALDVRRGEAVLPFWDWGAFAVATGNARVTIGGNLHAPFDPGWRRVRGSLAAQPDFQVREDRSSPAAIPPALPAPDGSEPRRVRLVRPAENPDRHPYGGVGFAFSGPVTDRQVAAFVGRVRLQTPRDTCFAVTQ